MSGSPPAAPPTASRRKRRWLRRLLWTGAGSVVLVVVMRVPLANAVLHRLPGDYEISVSGWRPGFAGATLTGVRVIHRPSGRQLGYVPEATVEGSWTRMIRGDLGRLTLTDPEVTWRGEFETPYEVPPPGGPPASPVVTWETGEIRGGVFNWNETGKEIPRLSLKIVSLDGGRFTIYNDGRVEAAEQKIEVREAVSREFTDDGRMDIETRSPRIEGILTAGRELNRYTLETVKLDAPDMKLAWRRGAPAGDLTATGTTTAPNPPPRPDWDKPVEFFIKDGTATPGKLLFVFHSPDAAPVELSAELASLHAGGIRAAGGLPFVVAAADAGLRNLKSPGATMEARELSVKASLDDRTRLHVTSAVVNGAAVTDSNRLLGSLGFTADEVKLLPVCRTGLDAKCVNLVISEDGLTSADPQQIVLQNFSALMPGEKLPVAKAPRVELHAVPDEALKDKRLRSVVADKLEVRIRESAVIREMNPLKSTAPQPPGGSPPEDAGTPPARPEWYGWHTDDLTVREGTIKGTDLGPGIPDASGSFSVRTAPREAGGDPFYQIRVDNIAFDNPLLRAISLKTGGVMDLDVHPVRLWDAEMIDEVRVNGHKVELNEAFIKLFEGGNTTPPAPAEARPKTPDGKPSSSSWKPRWKIGRLVVDNCEVAIPDIGDGRRLVIPVRGQVFQNVPLSTAMLEHDSARTVQKVEVPAIYLYAPFNEGHTVAELPVNFIHFTFAGLIEKRLERVELVNPKIKAGKPLFDFIEVTEKRFTPPAATPVAAAGDARATGVFADGLTKKLSALLLAAIGGQVAAGAPADQPARLTKPAVAVWDIPFFTDYGMVITAPNGVEWPEIPRLPFRNARIREGPDKGKPIPFRLRGDEVHGELAIEPGWYEFPQYKLRLRMSDEGRVVFNFPLKDRDNNLVEVFKNNTVIYRHLVIEKVWLSVTYDQQGIYIGFGGETCGGYITGKINLYLDALYSWDASASFTGIDTGPLTGRLTREYVLMTGKVDVLNVTAYGDMTGLYQTTANLKMAGPGRLQVKALDELRQRFITKRVDWTDDFGRVGLDALRDFTFTSCEGTARLFGQEGQAKLALRSAAGSRDITINLHDYRNHPEKSVIRF